MADDSQTSVDLLKAKLKVLDNIPFYIHDKEFKASQCYRYGLKPLHILFNANCPRYVREQIEFIIQKYAV